MARGWRLKITPNMETKILHMYNNGKSMHAIAMALGVSSATVLHYLRFHVKDDVRKRRKNRYSAHIQEMKAMYNAGYSTIALARKFDTAPSVMHANLRKAGVDTTKGGKYGPKMDARAVRRLVRIYRETGSILKTARILGFHPSSVHYRLVKLGVTREKFINQQMAKRKDRIFADVLTRLFAKMGYEIVNTQMQYNAHGPDMVLQKGGEKIAVEHKALVKRSSFWRHAISEAKTRLGKSGITKAIVVTTANRYGKVPQYDAIEVLFLDDLEMLLKKNHLEELLPKVEFLSTTPSL